MLAARPALDGQVVEVAVTTRSGGGAGADVGGERQRSTSASGTAVRPCASATGRQDDLPVDDVDAGASAGSAAHAPRRPRLASSIAYGSVTLVSA